LAMGSVAIDTTNTNVIYAGTGELNNSADSYYGCGILRSVDGGDTWTPLGQSIFRTTTGGARISKIVIDASSHSTLLAATSFGLYRSLHAGTDWTPVLTSSVSLGGDVASDVVQDPTNPAIMYAAQGNVFGGTTAQLNGIYKSIDHGATWVRINPAGFPVCSSSTCNVGRINLAVSTDNTGKVSLFAAVEDANNGSTADGQLLGLFVTTDGGNSWTSRTASFAGSGSMCNTQCWYSMALAVDPRNPSIVYFGGLSLYRSTDGGATFSEIGSPIHVDQHAIAFDPTNSAIMYAGNDGGIFKTTNATSTQPFWTSLNTNLSLTQFYAGLSVSPIDSTVIVGGTQDNGTLQSNGTSNWPNVLGGDGGFTAMDQLAGTVTFAETQWPASGSQGPWRRDPTGSGFSHKTVGMNLNDRASFIPPMAMDPAHPRILFFGTQNLYRTSNSGDLWTMIGPNLIAATGVINAIGIAPSDTLTAYVGSTDARVSYTHDGGTTWIAAAGLPNAAVTDFAVDPRNALTAVVVFGGFLSSHVWKTTDGGVSWSDLTLNLPNTPTLSVVLEPGSLDIDIGTDIGVFTLRNGSSSWSPVVNGLPNVAVYDLVFDTQRSRLIAATHGRGVFSLNVAPAPVLRGDIDGNGRVEAIDAQIILASVVGLAMPAGAIRYPNGDANCDGQVSAADALLVLMKVAGLPTGGACVGTIH
jgi:photosystem II stability/assembly factor-like uncharacterized protein